MVILILVLIGLAFTAFAALVFSILTLLLGTLFKSFDVSGPDDWSFWSFYVRYLIVAAVFTFVSLPLQNVLLGVAALAVAYKYVFDAGWVQAAVMGTCGGFIAMVLFVMLVRMILTPFGLIHG